MEEPIDTSAEPGSPDAPVGAEHAPGDPLLEQWLQLAATAWEGFLLEGPGCIAIMVDDAGTEFIYRPGSPCSCHPLAPGSYDPRTEVVVVDPCDGIPARLRGWPDPPEAYTRATADGLRRRVQ